MYFETWSLMKFFSFTIPTYIKLHFWKPYRVYFFSLEVLCVGKNQYTLSYKFLRPLLLGFWKKYRNQIRIEFQHYFIRSIYEFLKILFFFSKTVLFGDPPTSLMIDSIVSSHWKKIHLLQCIYLYPCVVCIVFLAKKTRMGPDWMKTRILLFILLRFRAFTW